MPKDFYEDRRVKNLPAHLQGPLVKALETQAAADVYDDLAQELAEQRQLRKDLPSLVKDAMTAVQAAVDRPLTVSAKLSPPAEPKPAAKAPTKASATFAAAAAELKNAVKHIDRDKTINEIFPGPEGKFQRQAAKAATTPGSTTDAAFAQGLTSTSLTGWIEELQPISVIGALGGQDLPFGNSNAIVMPRRAGRGHVSGSFVGENNTIPVKSDMFGSVMFNRYKAAVISPFSAEIAEVSAPDLVTLLRTHVAQDTAVMLDSVLLDPANAVETGIRPASPWNGAANQSSTGTDLSAILTDIAWLLSAITHAGVTRDPVIIMDPDRHRRLSMARDSGTNGGSWVFSDMLAQGKLFDARVIVSATVPTDHVFAIEASDFARWLPAPELDISDQAAIVMVDDDGTDPTMAATNAVSAAGSVHVSDAAGVTGGPAEVKSMFQSRLLALRMCQPVSWGMLRSGSTAYLDGVNW